MSLTKACREWAEQNPLPSDLKKMTVDELRDWIKSATEADEKILGDKRHFKVITVLIYPENTEYPFAKEILTNKKRSDSVRHWFPVFELVI